MFRIKYIVLFFPILIAGCSPKEHIQKVETKEYIFSKSDSADLDMSTSSVIKSYRDALSADMNTVLAVSEQALEKGQPESLLGNFFSDACLEIANQYYKPADNHPADFSFFNNGGLRSPLPKGNITKGNVFELMPFENELIILTVKGTLAKKIFNFIAAKNGEPVAGVRFGIQNKEAVNITVNGEPFDSTKSYKAVTTDYLASGGDQYFFLADAEKKDILNLKVRDAIIQHLLAMGNRKEKVNVKLDQRISNVR